MNEGLWPLTRPPGLPSTVVEDDLNDLGSTPRIFLAQTTTHDGQPHQRVSEGRRPLTRPSSLPPLRGTTDAATAATGGRRQDESWVKVASHDSWPHTRVTEGLWPPTRPPSLPSTVGDDRRDLGPTPRRFLAQNDNPRQPAAPAGDQMAVPCARRLGRRAFTPQRGTTVPRPGGDARMIAADIKKTSVHSTAARDVDAKTS